MSDTVYALIEAQENLTVKINNTYPKFASRPDVKRTLGASQAELQCLEDYFVSFKSNHVEILRYKDHNPELDYFTSSFIDEVEDFYFENNIITI